MVSNNNTPDLLNPEIIAQLQMLCEGDAEFGATLLNTFRQQMDDSLPQLEQLLHTHELAAASQLAHKLKGAALNLGAHTLALLLETTEMSPTDNDGTRAAGYIQLLMQTYQLSLAQLTTVLT